MRVQICSKCKQPRKGHICPFGDPAVKIDAKVEEDSQSDSSVPLSASQPPNNVIQGPPLVSNGVLPRQVVNPPPAATFSHPAQQPQAFRSNGESTPLPKLPISNGFPVGGNEMPTQNPEFGPSTIVGGYSLPDAQRRGSDISALSEELVQRAARLHQETDALVILYVTGAKNDRSQNNIRRFISAPLTEHSGMFEDVDRNCIELLDSCKNTQNASRDELIHILTERTHELYQSRRQLESLKRKLGYM
ncbi:hypothetical protein K493DRAFT_312207 [Basidiobolus meristosporus CBS 931.73]|uniref:Uncharacterized protein n=1 Tax=Basidiobolus meristosporus CBS 931.73 TaxID=1314790 RepID=A0A1Y1YVF1_9FUNG|nr:hypothetical protein K493DRAFT_312207 [Basidiobolus meristosporus CBS 931.73]|eukprot:ORY02023.1 hypothetical protein K493DRAFT_312207 [Basidiobolus meristosporus CBS 931.73]